MVINDLNVIHIAAFPGKANAPLLVDPYAVLSLPVKMQCLQMVGRRDPQGFKNARRVKDLELDRRHPLDVLRQLGRKPSVEKLLGLFTRKLLDHRDIVSLRDNIVKGY
jgi:hypothetical protein